MRRQVLRVDFEFASFGVVRAGDTLYSLHLGGAISSSGSKKGQVEMGAAAGFLVSFKVQVGPDCVLVFFVLWV